MERITINVTICEKAALHILNEKLKHNLPLKVLFSKEDLLSLFDKILETEGIILDPFQTIDNE